MFEYEDKNWCEKMRIRLDFNNVMQNFIDGGFSQKISTIYLRKLLTQLIN